MSGRDLCEWMRNGLVLAVLAGTSGPAATLNLDLPTPNGSLLATIAIPGDPGTPPRFAGATGAVFSSGAGVISVIFGGEVLLWDSETGDVAARLGRHEASVDGLEASRDGLVLASASSGNGVVRAWELATGAPKGEWTAADGRLAMTTLGRRPLVTVSPDGKWVAASGAVMQTVGTQEVQNAGRLHMWEVGVGGEAWSVPDAGVTALAFSPGGETLVAYCRRVTWMAEGDVATGAISEQQLRVFDPLTGAVRASVPIPGTNVTHLLVPDSGNEMLALAGARSFWFDAGTGRPTRSQAFPITTSLRHAQMDAAGRRLLVLEFAGDKLHLVDLEQGTATMLWRAASSLERISAPGFSADLRVGAGLRGTTPFRWDLPFPRLTRVRPVGNDLQVSVAAVKGGSYALLRAIDVEGPWHPVSRGVASGDELVLTDTNAAVGATVPRFYRTARE